MGVETGHGYQGHEMSEGGAQALDVLSASTFGLIPGSSSTVSYTPEDVNVNTGAGRIAGGDAYRQQFQQGMQSAQNRGAHRARFQEDSRRRQLEALQMLGAQARGEAPSAAEIQMGRAQQQASNAAMSQARSMRGGNPLLAQKMAGAQGARAQADIAGQTAALRAQEQARAQSALVQGLGGMRSQDQSVNLANLQAQMQQEGLNDAHTQAYLNSLMGMEQAELGAQAGLEQTRIQAEAQERANALQAAIANQQSANSGGGGLLGGLMG